MGMDTGDTAFMLVAAALVLIMTPGLAFFYGGLVGSKNVLAIKMQCLISMAVTTVLWIIVGYSMSFGSDVYGIIGNPLDHLFLTGIQAGDIFEGENIPVFVFVAYQLMFAILTPALMTGAFANRMTFKAYLLFLITWNLFVYFPFVHMIWGGGILYHWGVQDFAGGIVVHLLAGFGALASVFYLGARRVSDPLPHNIPFIILGTSLLWFGWFGFNAGSALGANITAGLAFLNTQLGASFAGITWLLLDWRVEGKPTVVGFCIGVIAGLATITPAAGYVSPSGAMLIGVAAGVVCYLAVIFVNKMKWDDALDVWGVHGIGGVTGILGLGLLGDTVMNPDGANGLFFGGSSFFITQLYAVLFAAVWVFVVTTGLLWIIDKITPVRVSDETEQMGLDGALHGETAYRQ